MIYEAWIYLGCVVVAVLVFLLPLWLCNSTRPKPDDLFCCFLTNDDPKKPCRNAPKWTLKLFSSHPEVPDDPYEYFHACDDHVGHLVGHTGGTIKPIGSEYSGQSVKLPDHGDTT